MKEKIKSLLNSECYIILDTNVYLNIYDRSPEFSRFSIEVLESIKDKIIIPSTVYREFLRNYRECYGRQKKKIKNSCSKLNSQIEQCKNKISNQCEVIKNFQFPHIDELKNSIELKLNDILSIIDEYIDESDILEIVNSHLMENDIVNSLVKELIKENQTTPEFSTDEIYKLTQIADTRYASKIPPGYEDKKEGQGIARYGDYFIWEQTLRFAADKKANIIFVTDDIKSDWAEIENGKPCFHSGLVKEFNVRVGTEFVGLNSLDFMNFIAEINNIEKSSAIKYALEYTTEEYIEKIVEDYAEDEIIDGLSYSGDKYIDMDSISASASEGIELSDDIDKMEYVKYEIVDIGEEYAIYNITYYVEVDATSYEYMGRDDDTKEVITSPGRIHKLGGTIVLEVERSVDEIAIIEGTPSYDKISIIEGCLIEISAYDIDDLCYYCGDNIGEYQDYSGNPVCQSCMKNDKDGEICTYCGKKIPQEYMYSDNSCLECAEKFDL